MQSLGRISYKPGNKIAPDGHGLVSFREVRVEGVLMKIAGSVVAIEVIAALLLASGAGAARGQSALDGFDPNANGTIRVAVMQPDGKVLIGGDFNTLSPNGGATVTRNHIARLNANGTLDAGFNPNANSFVYAIALQADGKILVGGAFVGANSIGGQSRNRIARLDPVTGSADTWNPNANGEVHALVVRSDGNIWVGGLFFGSNSIGGATRNGIARLDPSTGLADSWDANANTNEIMSLAVQSDGKLIVGGGFFSTSFGGPLRSFIVRLDPITAVADSFNPDPNGQVETIAIQPDGKIVVGGNFNIIGGQTRRQVARLDPSGATDSFDPNANGIVHSIVLQTDGKILVGGEFVGANSIGGQTRNRIARLDPASGLADAFNPNVGGIVRSIAVQADGKILAGGDFTTLAPNGGALVTRNHIALLETDGRVDQTLNLNTANGSITATAVQPDGKILIGGNFGNVLNVARNHIARLNADGTLDMAFNPNANFPVNAIAVQADGKILVGGSFQGTNGVGGATRNRIARLDATTGAADSFDPNSNGTVDAIAVQADGKILVGGLFTTLAPNGGATVTRNHIARLNTDGTLDTAFDPNATGEVDVIAVQADGKILVGGSFGNIGGALRLRIARLDPTTGAADSFNPSANDQVNAIAVQTDGKVLAGGAFLGSNSIGGATRNFIARLDPTTGAADSFDPNVTDPGTGDDAIVAIAVQADGKILVGGTFFGTNSIGGATRNFIARLDPTTGAADSFDPNASDPVDSIAVQADGKILVGGVFSRIGGQTRAFFARLTNDTAALQNLAVPQTAITWTRGGSSPQFTRVTFESSTDAVNYTPLDNGTTAGGNWTLTGLNLPSGQNFYIRARGYYRSGADNASESVVETVRSVFLPTLKIISITHAANGHVMLQCLGVPNQINDLQVSPDLSPGSFITLMPAPPAADGAGAFSYDDAGAVGLTKRFYRLAFP